MDELEAEVYRINSIIRDYTTNLHLSLSIYNWPSYPQNIMNFGLWIFLPKVEAKILIGSVPMVIH